MSRVLMLAGLLLALHPGAASSAAPRPFLLPLRRESVPVVRGGRTVSHKSAYYGTISLGAGEPQEFSVVFDTGSGHVVVPSVDCASEACLTRRRYNISASAGAQAIHSNGELVPHDELSDQVTIGFGTGMVKGEFAKEKVCSGPRTLADDSGGLTCTTLRVVMAVEMSAEPFKSFAFDGIFGLGLGSLALSPEFSFFGELARAQASIVPRFGIYLTGEKSGRGSEIAVGGHNQERVRGSLSWAPVVKPQLGYWQVQVLSIRVGDVEVEACRSSSCRAIVDTGTSHLGVPKPHLAGIAELLAVPVADDGVDCRRVAAPVLRIELAPNLTLELGPEDYMGEGPPAARKPSRSLRDSASPEAGALCRPRLMPVSLQAPLGPDLFILGEPVLRRYYTVYDWKAPRVGFGVARGAADEEMPEGGAEDEAEAEQLSGIYLVQVELTFLASRPL